MIFHSVPFVPGVQSAAKLRTAAALMHSRFELSGSGAVLKSFWDDQLSRMAQTHGTPFDGVYLGPGLNDLRPQCYAVQSHLRLYPNAKDKADVTALFTYLRDAADAIGKPPVVNVTAATVTEPSGKNAG